jgi:phospholipid transport system substrate-binding protein
MLTRRTVLALTTAAALHTPASAQSPGANAFVTHFANDLIQIINGPGGAAEKKAELTPVIDRYVDVPTIARFCLGRFWSTATPAQQQEYVTLFHKVLLNNISGHLGEYQGVSYTITGTHPQGPASVVATVITRPNAPPANVSWVINDAGGTQKIVDVVAEGTSLRVQQRADYTSYLQRHNNNIDALIAALQRQLNGA